MDADWNAAAPAWDRHRTSIEAMKSEVTARLLAAVRPLRGLDVLELGGGTGELSARLAAEIGETGSLLATDLAPGMLALLRERLASYPVVEVARQDAMSIDGPDDAFDVVVFRMGLMMAAQPEIALQGIRRVLRPGGTFVTAVWASPADNPWMTAVGMSAAMHGLVSGGPPIGPGGPFSLSDPDDLEHRVRSAGFDDVTVEAVESVRRYRDSAQQVEELGTLSPQLAAAFLAATAEQLAAVTETAAGLTARYAEEGGGVAVPVTALLCVAR